MENVLYALAGILFALGIWYLSQPRKRTIKSFWDMVRNPDLMPDFDAIEKDITGRAAAISESPLEIGRLVDQFVFEVESADEGWAIKRVLRELGEQVNSRLVEILKDESLRDRLTTFTQVSDWKSEAPLDRLCELFDYDRALPPDAIPPLGGLLNCQDVRVRKCVARTLGQDATSASLPYLLRALRDEDENVRERVLSGLPFATKDNRFSPDIAKPLFDAISTFWPGASGFCVDDKVPRILLALDRDRAVERMLKSDVLNAETRDARLILEALNRKTILVPRPQLLNLIERASEDIGTYPKDYLVREALTNLGMHRDAKDVPLLEKYLEHPEEKVCEGAVLGLYAYHRFFETIRNPRDVEDATGWDSLTMAEKHIIALEEIDAEVCNGGFSQYYFNSSGKHWKDARDGLRAIGSVQRLRFMEETLATFPDATPSIDRNTRNDQLARIARKQKRPFETQDDGWYKSTEKLDLLMFRYNLANRGGREKQD